MKKLLLSTALVLSLCAPAAAQNINRSLQASQDATGPYGVDTNFNLYIQNNRHILYSPNASPGLSVSGAGCVITAGSTDANGQVTGCSAAAALTFGTAYITAPRCVASSSNSANVALTVSSTTTVLTITPNTVTAATWNWFCGSVS